MGWPPGHGVASQPWLAPGRRSAPAGSADRRPWPLVGPGLSARPWPPASRGQPVGSRPSARVRPPVGRGFRPPGPGHWSAPRSRPAAPGHWSDPGFRLPTPGRWLARGRRPACGRRSACGHRSVPVSGRWPPTTGWPMAVGLRVAAGWRVATGELWPRVSGPRWLVGSWPLVGFGRWSVRGHRLAPASGRGYGVRSADSGDSSVPGHGPAPATYWPVVVGPHVAGGRHAAIGWPRLPAGGPGHCSAPGRRLARRYRLAPGGG